MLVHKITLSKSKNIETIPNTFADSNGMKLDISNLRNSIKYANAWRQQNTLLSEQWVTEKKLILKSANSWE